MRIPYQELVKQTGLNKLPAYFGRQWARYKGPTAAELAAPFLAEADFRHYADWFGFDAEWIAQIQSAARRIDADQALKTAALFVHHALYRVRPFYEVPWFPKLEAGALGEEAAMFGMCVLCREAPLTVADLARRAHPNPKDVLRNFRDLGLYSRQFRRLEGRFGLGNAAWCALTVTPYLNTAHHLRFAPTTLNFDYTFYRHRHTGEALVLVGPGLELRADGLLPAEGDAPAFETVYEREGSRVLAHRLRASGFIGPRPERFDLADYEVLVRPGDTLLGFHIPTGPGYDIPTSRASFEAALDLFLKVYPEVPVKGFYCDSWLFSPQLALMIKPADSRIVAIQRELFMLPIHADKEAFGTFLYGLDRLPKPEDLAHDSRLRALVRAWLMEGRYLSVGGAILPLDELARFGQTPYFRHAELDEFAALAQAADA